MSTHRRVRPSSGSRRRRPAPDPSLGLDADSLAEAGVDAGLAAQASQSYAAAVSIAREHGLDELASRATASFNGSVVLTSAVGGLIMVIVAVLVHRLVPRGLDLQSDE